MENKTHKKPTLTHASLFSGIGGFDLAAEWMGWENIFHCENNAFCQKVLNYHFKNSISYGNIKTTDFTVHAGQIDILTGGFPCQPYSTAGKRLGKSDERHLFPEMLRAIKEIKPTWIIGENVRGLIGWNEGLVFHEVYDDLEREGYEVQSFLIPAASVNAPHQRQRIWFIAYANDKGGSTRSAQVQSENGKISEWNDNAESCNSGFKNNVTNSESIGQEYALENGELEGGRFRQSDERNFWDSFPSKSPLCGGDDGLPRELDNITFSKWRNESIKAYGNAVCPQVVLQLFQTIQIIENYAART
jgi:DNA (cytosine-5)-methyltransferase 1